MAHTIRQRTIETSARAKIPHLGSCLSCVELLTALYWQELNINPEAPESPNRDRFVLSKGHGAPILFQVLAEEDSSRLSDYPNSANQVACFMSIPPKPGYIPGVEAATGSLGHGLPMALGMAIAARIQQLPTRCYALLSDGECNEGSIWEAAMLAGGQKINNLTAIVDYNKWQATGRSQEVMALEPLGSKWATFGWHVQEVDGHNLDEISKAFKEARNEFNKPSVIVAHTIKGKVFRSWKTTTTGITGHQTIQN